LNVSADLDPHAEIARLRAEIAALREQVGALQARAEAAEAAADHDVLTPTLNRRGFITELNRTMAFCARYGSPAVLLYLDLDGFKGVNDRLGHAAGDAALVWPGWAAPSGSGRGPGIPTRRSGWPRPTPPCGSASAAARASRRPQGPPG
jgi:GAF domain-containing protein